MLRVSLFAIILGVIIIIVGGYLCASYIAAGIFTILVGICLIAFIIFLAFKANRKKHSAERKIQNEIELIKQKTKTYNDWLVEQGFETSEKISDFLYDTQSMKWSVNLKHNIFDFAEIEKAMTHKESSRSSYTYGNKSKRSRDTSKYTVMIYTNNITYPLVTIDCGHSVTNAERICAVIKIMKKKVKAENI